MTEASRIAELEKIVAELTATLSDRDRRIAELEKTANPPPVPTSPEEERLIKWMNMFGKEELNVVAGYTSCDVSYLYESAENDKKNARSLLKIVKTAGMLNKLGEVLLTCYSDKSPSYAAWKCWRDVRFM